MRHVLPCVLLLLFAAPARADEGGSGLGAHLQVGAFMPRTGDYRTQHTGIGAAASSWSEMGMFGVEPRVAAHYGRGDSVSYLNVATDIGLFFLPMRGVMTPIIGGGIGLRLLRHGAKAVVTSTGTVITATSRHDPSEYDFGWGGYGRLGLLALRGAPLRLTVTADYTFSYLGPGKRPEAVVVSAGVIY